MLEGENEYVLVFDPATTENVDAGRSESLLKTASLLTGE